MGGPGPRPAFAQAARVLSSNAFLFSSILKADVNHA
jgi:hypothetical protein